MAVKIIKITVSKKMIGTNHIKYSYPEGFNITKLIGTSMFYDCVDISGKVLNETWTDEAIAFVQEEDLKAFEGMKDVIEITQEDADTISKRSTFLYKGGVKFISDPAKVISICEKVVAGTAISTEEKDAIDSSKDGSTGINQTKALDISAIISTGKL